MATKSFTHEVEEVAKAMAAAWHNAGRPKHSIAVNPDYGWPDSNESIRNVWRQHARAAIEALDRVRSQRT